MSQSEIVKDINDGALRLRWSNRRVRKDNFTFLFLVIFWIIWAPLTLFVTGMIFAGHNPIFFIIWCIFGWLGTLFIPYTLFQGLWSEYLVVSVYSISHGFVGFLAPKPKTFSLDRIREIVLGRCNDESIVTLNIYETTHWWYEGRHMLAYWLAAGSKEELFRTISDFVDEQKIPLKLRREP